MQHDPAAPDEAEQALIAALDLHLPGLKVIDRALELPRAGQTVRTIELVARDAARRVVLIDLADGAPNEAALSVLELLAFARQRGVELERRFGGRGVSVVVVLEGAAAQASVPLGALVGEELLLFEISQLRSAGGAQLVLSPCLAAGARREAPTRASFLAELSDEAARLAEGLWEQLEGPALGAEVEIGRGSVRWSDERGPLCSLARRERGLAGRLEGLDEELELQGARDGRDFLDAVIALHLGRSSAEDVDSARGVHDEALDPRQPLLSAAEIAAFHG